MVESVMIFLKVQNDFGDFNVIFGTMVIIQRNISY